jgi:hypothetical protein
MPTPWISIVVNNFNYARFLPQAVSSALAQTYENTEVVVVDDASSDESRSVIHGFGDRVRAVLQERNAGQGAAFNAGVKASRGDVVLFLDADDYLYPHAAATIAAAWKPGLSKMQYRLDLVDAQGSRIGLYPAAEVRFESGDVVPRLLAVGRYETTVTSGNAFSREALARVLPVPEADFRISADGYLVSVVPFHGEVGSIETSLGAYRLHGANAWAQGASDLKRQLHRALEHDKMKYHAIRMKAGQLGLVASPSLGMADTNHLSSRIAALVLEAHGHPYPSDRRAILALRGALATRSDSTAVSRKAITIAWFLVVGFLPRPFAQRAVWWRLAPNSRSASVSRMFRAIRRVVFPGSAGSPRA